jgi:hypothetical protein
MSHFAPQTLATAFKVNGPLSSLQLSGLPAPQPVRRPPPPPPYRPPMGSSAAAAASSGSWAQMGANRSVAWFKTSHGYQAEKPSSASRCTPSLLPWRVLRARRRSP